MEAPRQRAVLIRQLQEAAAALEKQGIETEIFQVGTQPVAGCVGCGVCRKNGECFRNDVVNEFDEESRRCRRLYLRFSDSLCFRFRSAHFLMDRAFYSGGSKMAGKPAAAVVSCRRGGATAGFDQINKYFTINNMPVVSSQYWNMVHGNTPDEVRQDEEGLQTMRTLGNNMAWLIKCIEAGKKAGITFPEREPAIKTNYIR